jgi:hypothetical protein
MNTGISSALLHPVWQVAACICSVRVAVPGLSAPALVLTLVVLGAASKSLAQNGQASQAAHMSCVQDPKHPCNGIRVGRPKVFDNRTLTLMLENAIDRRSE